MDKKNNASRKAARIARQRRQRNRRIALTVCLLLAVCMVTVGGTLAWLTASTGEVKNTFTTADIDVTLTETFNTDNDKDSTNDKWQAQMIPGYSYAKDPKVEVSTNSVDCYLFVKFEETNDPSTYLAYTSTLTAANGWTQGKGEDGDGIPTNVWYRKVMASDTTRSWELLSGNTISVKDTVTKDNMATAASATLTYTAYASQLYKSNKGEDKEFSAKEAWNNVNLSK